MDWIEAMGYFGTFLTCVTFVPQVYKTWQTRKAGDLSLAMLLIVVTSTIVWLVYAFGKMLWPVIIANAIVFVLSIMLVVFKLTFRN